MIRMNVLECSREIEIKVKVEKKPVTNYLEGLHRETGNQGWSIT